MRKYLINACLLLIFISFSLFSWAQSLPMLEQIQSGKALVEAASDLTEEQRMRLLETYDQTLTRYQQWERVRTETEELERLLGSVAERTQTLREQSQGTEIEALSLPDDIELSELELMISTREGQLAQAREVLRTAEGELARLLGGGASLSEAVATRTASLEQVLRDLTAIPAEAGDIATRARLDNLLVRKVFNEADIALKRLQLANQPALTSLQQALRDASNRQIALLQAELEQLFELAQSLREGIAREAAQQADQLSVDARRLPAEIAALADENRELRAELARLVRSEQGVSESLQRARQEFQDIRSDFERIRNRVEVVGRSETLAKVLHARRSSLPSLQSYRVEQQQLEGRIRAAIERQLSLDDSLAVLTVRSAEVERALAGLVTGLDASMGEQLRAEAINLLEIYGQSLNELQQTYARYVGALTNLDIATRERFDVARHYVDYIEDQLLWMPNTNIASLLTVDHLDWTIWLINPRTWWPTLTGWIDFAKGNVLSIVLVLMLFYFLRRFNGRAVGKLKQIDESLNRVRTDLARNTLTAALLVALRVLPVPLALFLIGRAMQGFLDPLSVAIGGGLVNSSLLLGCLMYLAQLTRPNGIGPRHLRWSVRVCAALRKPIRWLTIIVVGATFLISLLGANDAPAAVQTVGSIVFAVMMAGGVFLLRHLFGEKGELRACIRDEFATSWSHQLHFLWYPLSLLIPLSLAVASLAGYYYTAMQFTARIGTTITFIFTVYLVAGIILRWLYVTERRLRFQDAVRRRDELRAQRASEEQAEQKDQEASGDVIVVETPEVNYESLSEQSRRLIQSGFLFAVLFGSWAIWANLIPALGFLQGADLPFETTRLIDGVSTVVPITLADILVGLFIVVVTFLAAKNLPGILELTLLQRLPLDSGARYAITALSQYFIVGVGLIIAVQTMGFQWSGLQWLIAALGVGLGFGLQEIVANFVSGIILLFERPIRVGDVVTVDNTTGVVTRIQIRATTITNYDKQELVVPNKEFITGRLINWTLSDKLNRILLPVGLAYGDDVDKALALMQEAAEEIPDILTDPGPLVSFESFGNDALMLYLRAYLGNMDNRLGTITALHRSIYNKFNAAGLSIAFPQRDVHLDIKHPLDIRWSKAELPKAAQGETSA